jgi:hypothetical protein
VNGALQGEHIQTVTCLVIINTLVQAKTGVAEFVYLIGIFYVIADLIFNDAR